MPGRVLLIEDEPNIIEAVRFILSRDGWRVDTHSDGETALEAVRHRRPDLIILDVMLPNRSGYDVLNDLRADEEHAEIPVLMLTFDFVVSDPSNPPRRCEAPMPTLPFCVV